jgi:hypothetical protein
MTPCASIELGSRRFAVEMDGGQASRRGYALRITLCDGFRGHAVVLTVGGREVYRRGDVTTAGADSPADTIELVSASRVTVVTISATPGNYVASIDLDVSAHPHVAVRLVGEGTVSFETSIGGFT